jgi:hypothetical protein
LHTNLLVTKSDNAGHGSEAERSEGSTAGFTPAPVLSWVGQMSTALAAQPFLASLMARDCKLQMQLLAASMSLERNNCARANEKRGPGHVVNKGGGPGHSV